MHMEEDAGKLIHDEWEDCSLVDYNRSGVPLVEIVSEPDMRCCRGSHCLPGKTPDDHVSISAYRTVSSRKDPCVPMSTFPCGKWAAISLGTRTEMKNLNSFKAIARAIDGERARQIELLEEGKSVVQETRRWDDNKEYSYAMRSKEDAKDYRYFPDPDLPSVYIDDEWISRVKKAQPEMQPEKAARYQKDYGLSEYDAASQLTQSRHLAELFEKTADLCGNPKKAANWFLGETLRLLKERGLEEEEVEFSPEHLAALIASVEKGEVNNQGAKEVFEKIFDEDVEPMAYIEAHGLKISQSAGEAEAVVDKILAANADAVEKYKNGEEKVLGFLVGQIMKEMKGKCNPGQMKELIISKVK